MSKVHKILNSQPLTVKKNKNQPTKGVGNKEYIPEPYKKFARNMEAQFAEFMIEQMNKTVPGHAGKSSAMNIYKQLQNSQRAKVMSETGGGLGVQKVILDQVYPKRFRNKIMYENYLKQTKRHAANKAYQKGGVQ